MDSSFAPNLLDRKFIRMLKCLCFAALMCFVTVARAHPGYSTLVRVGDSNLEDIHVKPESVFGGGVATGTVSLSGPAPATGAVVSLVSDNAAVTVPASVTVAAGAKQATFSATTTTVGARTVASITATLGTKSRHTQLIVLGLAVKSLSLAPNAVTGGDSSTATLTLNAPAPTGGVVLSLASSSPAATVPATASVDAGQSTATFTVTTSAVTKQVEVRIKANLENSSETAQLTVSPPESLAVAVNPTTVIGGAKTLGTVTLTNPAPANGLEVKLVSSSNLVQVDQEIKVKSGATTASFGIRTEGVATSTTVTISASVGSASANATLTVSPATLASVVLDPNGVGGGASTTGLVTLTGAAPEGGALVNLASSLTIAQIQTSVKVPAGHSSATFAVSTTPVTTSTSVTISATYGSVTQTAILTVNPLGLASLAVHPGNREGKSATGVVELNSPAGAGGVVVAIASDNSAATVPAAVTVLAGHSSASFSITTSAVTSTTTVTITASLGGASKTATLTLNPVTLQGLRLNPDRVVGGSNSTATITLSGNAPAGGFVVTLASNSASAVVPTTVTVPAGQNAVTFPVSTSVVTSKLIVQITATSEGISKSENLTIITQKG